MPHSHRLPRLTGVVRPGADLQIFMELVRADDQAVVPRGDEWVLEPGEDPFRVMMNVRHLSMHQAVGAVDFPAIDLADALVPEADSQKGHLRAEAFDHLF